MEVEKVCLWPYRCFFVLVQYGERHYAAVGSYCVKSWSSSILLAGWHYSCNVMGFLAAHVDDFILGGSHAFSTAVIPNWKMLFKLDVKNSFSYIGMQVNSLKDEIQVQQSTCIKSLHIIPVDPTRAIEFDMFKATIGPIVSVARQSRPDIMCDISILATQTQSMLLSRPCTVQTNSSEN